MNFYHSSTHGWPAGVMIWTKAIHDARFQLASEPRGATLTITSSVEQRRQPSQQRSKATVDRILKAAEALIAKHGTGSLQMREIALRARVPIGVGWRA